jgi:hypothetical protein
MSPGEAPLPRLAGGLAELVEEGRPAVGQREQAEPIPKSSQLRRGAPVQR